MAIQPISAQNIMVTLQPVALRSALKSNTQI